MLDALRDSGHFDEALIAVTSDHGEEFGENGQVLHGNNLHRVLSVYPGRTRGRMQREVCRGLGQRYDAERFLDPADVATAIVDAAALPPSAEVYDLRIRPASKPRL